MKSIYVSLLCVFLSLTFYGQITTLTLSDNNVCNGDIVTATLHSKDSLLVPAIGGNANAGYMFDIDAHYQLTITGFKVNFVGGPASFEVYYRYGTHVGYEVSATDWTLLGSSTGIVEGTNVNIGISFSVPVDSGQTVAFYVTRTDGPSVIYNNGTAVGNVIATNTNYLSVKTGVGKGYPFAGTNNNRNFEGTVLYEPGFKSVVWNNGTLDTTVAEYVIDRTQCVQAIYSFKGGSTSVRRGIVNSKEIDVTILPNPDYILPGGTSTLTSQVELKKGLATTFSAGNNFLGIMFDVIALKSLQIKGLSVSLINTDAPVEVFYKTGSHIGFETNAGVWTSLGTSSIIAAGTDKLIPLSIDIPVASGERIAFYISRSDGERLSYTNGTSIGSVYADDGNLQILEGTGLGAFFSDLYSPRVPNTVVLYEVDNFTAAGMTYSWSTGSPSGSIIVSPMVSTDYSLTVTYDGCSASDTVNLKVSGVGFDEFAEGSVKVFPNPTTENITIELSSDNLKGMTYRVVDIYGSLIKENTIESNVTIVGFESVSAGVYFVQLIDNNKVQTSFKVIKQ